MIRVGLALIWLLHFLPLALLAPLGRALGLLLFHAARERRRVGRINLRMCFPELSETERRRLLRRHFQTFGRAALERGIVWWSSKARVMRVVRIEGLEHWKAVEGQPVIWLAPHFVGLDMGGTRLAAEFPAASMYSRQKNPHLDAILYHGRTRFVMPRLFSRQDGVRPMVKAIRDGLPFYYLPDMDFGPRDSGADITTHFAGGRGARELLYADAAAPPTANVRSRPPFFSHPKRSPIPRPFQRSPSPEWLRPPGTSEDPCRCSHWCAVAAKSVKCS